MQRRDFLSLSLATAASAPAGTAANSAEPYLKSICGGIFPTGMPLLDQLRAASNAGFRGIEVRLGRGLELTATRDEVQRLAEASRRLNVAIVSIWPSGAPGGTTLNDDDPQVRATGVENIRKAITLAKDLNCGALLIVPGRLGDGAKFQHGYQQTWDRVTAEMKKLVADAERWKVYLTPENVWSKFLVSPLEMRTFLDQFQSPWIQAHFDIGNVMQFGYPQDWIATLGTRIKRVHVKDYKLSTRPEQGRFVDLLEGDVDWKEVMAALRAVSYRGFMSPEYGPRPADPEYLMKVSRALDRILAMG
ncbi:MAG: sugar phosphate isomerase/epimerase [Bryobacterales bacterium]|nr:sugar phosphate isomerase/epimerase [Bryobacterales bacterium]